VGDIGLTPDDRSSGDQTAIERALALRVRDGDGAAFDELDRRVRADLRRFLASKLRAAPHVDVDDAVQDTLVYVLDRLRQGLYIETYPFRVFLFALARRIVARRLDKRVAANRVVTFSTLESPDEPGEVREFGTEDFSGFADVLRNVAGASRFDVNELSEIFEELLEVFYAQGGYPHQQLTFGFSVLLWGRAGRKAKRASADSGKVPITGDSGRVIDECAEKPLEALAGTLAEELSGALGVSHEWLNSLQTPLLERLKETLAALTEGDARSRKVYERLLERVAGGTRLEEYFGRNPQESVANWTRQVKDRIRRVYADTQASADDTHEVEP